MADISPAQLKNILLKLELSKLLVNKVVGSLGFTVSPLIVETTERYILDYVSDLPNDVLKQMIRVKIAELLEKS